MNIIINGVCSDKEFIDTDHGILSWNSENNEIRPFQDGEEVVITITRKTDITEDFFEDLATKLRVLWPAGEKDGKYPWRDSVKNLVKRLEFLWKEREFSNKYTVDDCLIAARKYLAQYETNAKYMQTLPYFIFKQTKIVANNGKITYIYKSKLADMLESNITSQIEDWSNEFETTSTYEQGDLI